MIDDQVESLKVDDSCSESCISETVSNEHDYTCLISSNISVGSTSYVQAPEVEDVWFDVTCEVPCLAGKYLLVLLC